MSLPLAGCEAETIEFAALGGVAMIVLLVGFILIAPPLQGWLARREHHKLMYERRPWSPEDAGRKRPPKARKRRRS
jgi:hypothetical protein